MRRHLYTLCSLAMFLLWSSMAANAQDYGKFFRKKHRSGVQYIVDLFRKSDIVILGERDHREMTQYQFIDSLLSDPWFIENVGAVYTEVGCINKTAEVNNLINARVPDSVFQRMLMQYLPNEDYSPMWTTTCRSVFLSSLHRINTTTAADRPIFLGLTDSPFDWDSITTEAQYATFKDTYIKSPERGWLRDSIMASHFLQMYAEQPLRNGHRKALLIQNIPHAVPREGLVGELVRSTCSRGSVKIIFMHSGRTWDEQQPVYAGGAPDMAFSAQRGTPVGFDVKGTPFADLLLWDKYRFGDIIDGLIFDRACCEWILQCGYGAPVFEHNPGLEQELTRRHDIYNKFFNYTEVEGLPATPHTPEEMRKYYGNIYTIPNVYCR